MVNITASITVIMGMRNDLDKLQIRNGDIGGFSFSGLINMIHQELPSIVFCFIIKHEEN